MGARGSGRGARLGAVGRALGEGVPGQVADQRAIVLDQRVALDSVWQAGERLFERAEYVGRWAGWRRVEGGAQPVEWGGKIE